MRDEKIDILSSALKNCATEEHIVDALFEFVAFFDIDKLAYHHLPSHQTMDFDDKRFYARGHSDIDVATYKRNHRIFACPISIYASSSSQTLTMQEACDLLQFSPDQKEFYSDFFMSDHKTGLVVPTFGQKNRNGVFVLKANTAERRHAPIELRLIKWACQEAHLKMCDIILEDAKKSISLTAREAEILTWVARGKSNSIIADIVGISPHTVNGYLRSVYLKTGVTDRTSAALVGVSKALIHI